jgi:hypothetical protein
MMQTLMKTISDDPYSLDKTKSNNHDVLDALRLSFMLYASQDVRRDIIIHIALSYYIYRYNECYRIAYHITTTLFNSKRVN